MWNIIKHKNLLSHISFDRKNYKYFIGWLYNDNKFKPKIKGESQILLENSQL